MLLDGPDQMKSSNHETITVQLVFGDQKEGHNQEASSKVDLEIVGSSLQLQHLLNTHTELKTYSQIKMSVLKESIRLNSNHTKAQLRSQSTTDSQFLKSHKAMLAKAAKIHSTQTRERTVDGGYQSSRKLMPSSIVSMLI